MGDSVAGVSQGTKYCSNCKRDIAAGNFVMHEVHCIRNIVLCKKCKEPVARSEIEDHDAEYHAEVKCDLCQLAMECSKLDVHKENCPKMPVTCDFCNLEFPLDELSTHTDYCGSRTEPCAKCGQYIMLRNVDSHELSDCILHHSGSPNTLNNDSESTLMNSFARGELRRIMGQPQVSVVRNEIGQVSMTKPKNKSTKNANISRSRQSNIRVPVNSWTPVNVGSLRSDAMYPDYSDEIEAGLLNEDSPWEGLGPAWEGRANVNEFIADSDGDTSVIPCEICNELFPFTALYDHQRACSAMSLDNVIGDSRRVNNGSLPNNSRSTVSATRPDQIVNPPNMVDNLSMMVSAQNDLRQVEQGDFDEDSNDFLPCEFCEELLPLDWLVQHQAVCVANMTQTPRVMTPAVPAHTRHVPTKFPWSPSRPNTEAAVTSQKTRNDRNTNGKSNQNSDAVPQRNARLSYLERQNSASKRKELLDNLVTNPMGIPTTSFNKSTTQSKVASPPTREIDNEELHTKLNTVSKNRKTSSYVPSTTLQPTRQEIVTSVPIGPLLGGLNSLRTTKPQVQISRRNQARFPSSISMPDSLGATNTLEASSSSESRHHTGAVPKKKPTPRKGKIMPTKK